MRLFLLSFLAGVLVPASMVANGAKLEASADGDLVFKVGKDNSLLVVEGDGSQPLDIISELKAASGSTSANKAAITDSARVAREATAANEACDGTLTTVVGQVAELVADVAKPQDTSKADGLLEEIVSFIIIPLHPSVQRVYF